MQNGIELTGAIGHSPMMMGRNKGIRVSKSETQQIKYKMNTKTVMGYCLGNNKS